MKAMAAMVSGYLFFLTILAVAPDTKSLILDSWLMDTGVPWIVLVLSPAPFLLIWVLSHLATRTHPDPGFLATPPSDRVMKVAVAILWIECGMAVSAAAYSMTHFRGLEPDVEFLLAPRESDWAGRISLVVSIANTGGDNRIKEWGVRVSPSSTDEWLDLVCPNFGGFDIIFTDSINGEEEYRRVVKEQLLSVKDSSSVPQWGNLEALAVCSKDLVGGGTIAVGELGSGANYELWVTGVRYGRTSRSDRTEQISAIQIENWNDRLLAWLFEPDTDPTP